MSGAIESAPRLAFVGVGWIGGLRLHEIVRTGCAEVAAIVDPVAERRDEAAELAPHAIRCESMRELGSLPLDGLVIASPSAVHAEQAIAGLEQGLAVFCQKPLGRSAREVERVVEAARRADRLLGIDFCYRHTRAVEELCAVLRSGELGRLFAAELVFHNAYGPDKPWFYQREQSGGGCVMDLGVHLVDLLSWLFDDTEVAEVEAQLHCEGRPLQPGDQSVEDHAAVQLRLASGVSVQLRCSWRLSAGRDAVIEATFFGTGGGVAVRNVDGSFFDFVAERYAGTTTTVLVTPPDAWGGRALSAWAAAVKNGQRYQPDVERVIAVHEVIDAIYARGGRAAHRGDH